MAIGPVVSAIDLHSRLDILKTNLCLPETEDTWEKILKSIKMLHDMCQNGACDFPIELVQTLRSFSRPITSSMVSERTRLSGTAIDFVSTVASGLGSSFDPLVPIFLPVLLSLCARTNKVVITRARACMTVIIESTQLPSILPHFLQSIKDKSASLRLAAAEGTLTCMNCFNPPDLEKEARARDIEAILRSTARDSQADIRLVGRKIFEAYKVLFPARVESFTAPLTPTMKKYLDIKTANAQTKSSAPRLTPTLETKPILSSSTSALSVVRGRPESFHPPPHTRSVSSSAISASDKAKQVSGATTIAGKTAQRVPTKASLTDMPPPQYVPVRPAKISSQSVSVTRSTSAVVDDRKRAVPASVRPVSGTASSTGQSSSSRGYPTRPTSASSLNDAPRRVQLQATILPGSSQAQSTGPRRVPIPPPHAKEQELNNKAQLDGGRARPDAPTRPVRLDSGARSTTASTGLTKEIAKPVPKVPDLRATGPMPTSGKATVTSIKVPPGKVARSGGVTQPTLSQLSRAKAAAESRGPANVTQKQPFGHTAPLKTKTKPSTRSTIPSSRQVVQKGKAVRPITPAQVPLPPSPTPSLAHSATDQHSESTTPSLPTPSSQSSVPLATASLPDERNNETPHEVAMTPEIPEVTEGAECSSTESTLEGVQPILGVGQVQETVGSSEHPLEVNADESDETIVGPPRVKCEEPGLPSIETSMGTPTAPHSLGLSENIMDTSAKTPISSLLSSIQRGFLFTPSSPLSPPLSYLDRKSGTNDNSTPFSLNAELETTDSTGEKHAQKPFMFGITQDVGRSALGNVENLETRN